MASWSALLTELAHTRGPELYRYSFLLCGDRDLAADLVQDALVRVSACAGSPPKPSTLRRT